MSDKTEVSVNLGYTLNLGNFESFRVDIGVTDHLRANEKVDDGFNRVFEYVAERLIEKVNEAKETLG
jgi:hypothetical protein